MIKVLRDPEAFTQPTIIGVGNPDQLGPQSYGWAVHGMLAASSSRKQSAPTAPSAGGSTGSPVASVRSSLGLPTSTQPQAGDQPPRPVLAWMPSAEQVGAGASSHATRVPRGSSVPSMRNARGRLSSGASGATTVAGMTATVRPRAWLREVLACGGYARLPVCTVVEPCLALATLPHCDR